MDIILLKEGYSGSSGFHAEDISIIVLQDRVSFSNRVAPVCIDWNSKFNVVNGNQGKVNFFVLYDLINRYIKYKFNRLLV